MAVIKPFKALRPLPAKAAAVASRPYDVLNSAEAKAEAAGNEDSFLHITKAEIDLFENMDTQSQPVYDKALANLQDFQSRGVLKADEKPCYYIYMLVMEGRAQTGL